MTVNEFVTTLRYAYDNSKLKSYITDIQNAKNKIGGALDGAAAAPLANANAQYCNGLCRNSGGRCGNSNCR